MKGKGKKRDEAGAAIMTKKSGASKRKNASRREGASRDAPGKK